MHMCILVLLQIVLLTLPCTVQVFAIIGLHTMGDIAMDAPNFNTFYAAFLTVFQVLFILLMCSISQTAS